jgi:hypothetical protein
VKRTTLASACSSGATGSAGSNATTAQADTSTAGPATTVDPTKIKGLSIVNDSSNDRSCPWATSYPAVPGATAMTERTPWSRRSRPRVSVISRRP